MDNEEAFHSNAFDINILSDISLPEFFILEKKSFLSIKRECHWEMGVSYIIDMVLHIIII